MSSDTFHFEIYFARSYSYHLELHLHDPFSQTWHHSQWLVLEAYSTFSLILLSHALSELNVTLRIRFRYPVLFKSFVILAACNLVLRFTSSLAHNNASETFCAHCSMVQCFTALLVKFAILASYFSHDQFYTYIRSQPRIS